MVSDARSAICTDAKRLSGACVITALKKRCEKLGADLVQEYKRPKPIPVVNVGPLTGG